MIADPVEIAFRLAVALGVGLLIGADRERHKLAGTLGHGIRTFALAALAGAASELVGGTALLAVIVGAFALLAAVAYPRDAQPPPGLTTCAALIVTVLLGAFAMLQPAVAAGLAVSVAILLAFRDRIHRFVDDVLSEIELEDLLILAAAALVVFPLLPDRYIGPFQAFNPRTIWRVVVLIMAIQAGGYVATRALGPRFGLPLAGFASGFVSSLATVAAMGARARSQPELLGSATAAAALSTIATLLQTAVIVGTTSPPVLIHLAVPLACAAVTAAIYGVIFTLIALREPPPTVVEGGRAVNVRLAVEFAALIAVVVVASAAFDAWFGRNGVTAAALLAGFADSHSPTASTASLVAAGKLAASDALVPILGAVSANTITKSIVAFTTGGRAYAIRIVPGLVLSTAAAWIGVLFVR
jgi:uncharacterized membrane protein (DUF4010 family)